MSSFEIIDLEAGNTDSIDTADETAPSTSSGALDFWEIPRLGLLVGNVKEFGQHSEMCFGKVQHGQSKDQVAVLIKKARSKRECRKLVPFKNLLQN